MKKSKVKPGNKKKIIYAYLILLLNSQEYHLIQKLQKYIGRLTCEMYKQ